MAQRQIDLKVRSARVTNVNFTPEKAGKTKVERCDVSLRFLLEELDVDAVINTKSNVLQLLWDGEGLPQLKDLDSIELTTTAVGECTLGDGAGEEKISFDSATLKKINLKPIINREAEMTCQVRVNPKGMCEYLVGLSVEDGCLFSFAGRTENPKKGKQGKLDV